jgi:hypothetical protein
MKQDFYFPAKRRIGRRRRHVVSSSLTLVAATYDVGSSVTLKFDQPIDISAINGPAIVVGDFINATTFVGQAGPANLIDPFTVQINLQEDGGYGGSTNTLTASDDTRIRSVPGAQAWPGVTDVQLPFP